MKYVMEILPSLRGLNKFVKWILKNEMRWDDGYFQESCKIITIPTQWNFKPYRNQKQNVLLSDNQNWNRVYRSAVVHSKLIRYENQMSRGSGAESCGVEQKHPTPGQVAVSIATHHFASDRRVYDRWPLAKQTDRQPYYERFLSINIRHSHVFMT